MAAIEGDCRNLDAEESGYAATARQPSHSIISEGWRGVWDEFRNWILHAA
jgi:hypothetical protein